MGQIGRMGLMGLWKKENLFRLFRGSKTGARCPRSVLFFVCFVPFVVKKSSLSSSSLFQFSILNFFLFLRALRELRG